MSFFCPNSLLRVRSFTNLGTPPWEIISGAGSFDMISACMVEKTILSRKNDRACSEIDAEINPQTNFRSV